MSALRRGHRRGEEPEGPSIRLVRLPGAGDADVRELLAGIEEEGVPVTVRSVGPESLPVPDAGVPVPAISAAAPAAAPTAPDVGRAAHDAARAATLRVGVAVAATEACVQLAALPAAAPPLLRRTSPGPEQLRRLGQDAARLVKAVPLTASPTDPTTDRSPR